MSSFILVKSPDKLKNTIISSLIYWFRKKFWVLTMYKALCYVLSKMFRVLFLSPFFYLETYLVVLWNESNVLSISSMYQCIRKLITCIDTSIQFTQDAWYTFQREDSWQQIHRPAAICGPQISSCLFRVSFLMPSFSPWYIAIREMSYNDILVHGFKHEQWYNPT